MPTNKQTVPERQSKKRAVEARWTPAIAKAGWTPISDYFLDNYHRLNITHGEAMLVVHLMRHKWDVDAPYPGFRALAKRMGISAEAARACARKLELKGLIAREMQIGATNKFHLTKLFGAIEKLMAQDKLDKAQRAFAVYDQAMSKAA